MVQMVVEHLAGAAFSFQQRQWFEAAGLVQVGLVGLIILVFGNQIIALPNKLGGGAYADFIGNLFVYPPAKGIIAVSGLAAVRQGFAQ
ncbi:hypothetical protein [Shewanella sp. NFH-SH190041]|uniref:hypothetical protein n=1 Tax=Shewanella sp. NFH-SH190041 TaxID=2950245 RepID=UPI0021C2BC65|nr:hypothetical protein [Shewanella sp. NFH-SH190041]